MSKVVHPYAHRLVILRDWKSRWFAAPKKYKEYLRGDVLRDYLEKKMRGQYVSSIEMERSPKSTRFIIRTSRPGMVIGRSGEGSTKLKQEIVTFMKKKNIPVPEELKLDIIEVTNPDADAHVVAYGVAEALEKRLPFRRVMKQAVERVIATRGVEGVKIVLSGRLGGAEIARIEEQKRGSIPLQTFRADVDYTREKAHMTYGDIGIKVWIYRGEVFDVKETAPATAGAAKK
jgi:small subunit ribosomal protein S3